MARFSRLQVLNTMLEVGLTPIFNHAELKVATQIVDACVRGGARTIEFTNRGDQAPLVFVDLWRYMSERHPDVILGVGTVLDPATAALYIGYGANFIVAPSFNRDVALLCNRYKVAYIPGCATPTEIATAEEMGVEIVKIFPSLSVGGPGFVKAVLGPSPWTRMMPTSGVEATQESITAWFKAGIACVGFGSQLLHDDWIKAGEFDKIAALTRDVLAWIREASQF